MDARRSRVSDMKRRMRVDTQPACLVTRDLGLWAADTVASRIELCPGSRPAAKGVRETCPAH